MKTIFTLLFCTLFFSAAFAQYDHGDWNRSNDNIYRNHDGDYREHRHHDYRDNNFFVYRDSRYWFSQRDEVIQRINDSYNYRIREVINDWYMSPWQKRHEIAELQSEKVREINGIYAQCNLYDPHPYNRHHHHDDDDDD